MQEITLRFADKTQVKPHALADKMDQCLGDNDGMRKISGNGGTVYFPSDSKFCYKNVKASFGFLEPKLSYSNLDPLQEVKRLCLHKLMMLLLPTVSPNLQIVAVTQASLHKGKPISEMKVIDNKYRKPADSGSTELKLAYMQAAACGASIELTGMPRKANNLLTNAETHGGCIVELYPQLYPDALTRLSDLKTNQVKQATYYLARLFLLGQCADHPAPPISFAENGSYRIWALQQVSSEIEFPRNEIIGDNSTDPALAQISARWERHGISQPFDWSNMQHWLNLGATSEQFKMFEGWIEKIKPTMLSLIQRCSTKEP